MINNNKYLTEVNHIDFWHKFTSARISGSITKSCIIKSLASFDIVLKYSSGKQKSHFNIFVVVSSKESSRNGERPLKNN